MQTSLIASITADGYIGRHANHLADWTSKEDKHFFVSHTKNVGTIIMGRKTFETIGRALPDRRMIVCTRNPQVVQVDGVEATNESPADLLQRLADEGVTQVAICGGAEIYGLFLGAGLIDELFLTIEPILFGTGVPLSTATSDTQLQLLKVRHLSEQTILLHYAVKH